MIGNAVSPEKTATDASCGAVDRARREIHGPVPSSRTRQCHNRPVWHTATIERRSRDTRPSAKLRELRAKLAESKSVEAAMLATVRELEETYAKLNKTKAKANGAAGTQRRELPLLERV